MSIPGSAAPFLLARQPEQYRIQRSLRFNSSDSAYLSRTPASAGNRKTWTWAGWVKRSKLGAVTGFFGAYFDATFYDFLRFDASDKLEFYQGNSTQVTSLVTTAAYRDVSAWYHIVLAEDSTQATASNRVKLYVNGEQVTSFTSSQYLGQNADATINRNTAHVLGALQFASTSQYFNGYLADIHFIDGQALDPTSFGEFDANGVWQPKAYTGTYGTNGFHLPFSDNSTAPALGTDTSGNGNDFTVVNISATPGVGMDSLVDSPTNYGVDTGAGDELRGNYATLNPVRNGTHPVTIRNGNLDCTYTTYANAASTISVSSGKWYWEGTLTTSSDLNEHFIGVARSDSGDPTVERYWSGNDPSRGVAYWGSTGWLNLSQTYGSTYAATSVIGVAFDADAGSITFYLNGVSQGTSSYSLAPGKPHYAMAGGYSSWAWSMNFGQRLFVYTPPSGYKALCTTNLPEPQTITTSGSYTGNGVADGPLVYLNGVPTAMTISGNTVTFGTHADKLSNGFKIRTNNVLYNQNAVTYTFNVTSTGAPFKIARAQSNP